ncbi:hypothetical protein JIN84_21445 [Luteolibacter yonseiensis]|uniref:Uncharacterized protein n=1 Tax=Luteolibacter yonseiensis TaxID=1144680 RepID=A0A934R954_9BACT|nr:hypothetical protein [Luteolibacter yonseiensis]MBK1818203.1 hypothetical protein [Luteolibacter yonseiensis]
MRTSNDTLPPYGPAAEIYRSANRNLVMALLLLGGIIAGILLTAFPGLDVGATGFDPWDVVLGTCISVFLASLFAIMLMYISDVHAPAHLVAFTMAMHAGAFGFCALLHFTDSPLQPPYSGYAENKVCLNLGAK